MFPVSTRLYPAVILLLVTMLLCTAVYFPGLSGPWIFDDYPNIIRNSYIHVTSLDGSSLQNAAFSMESGPLRRPISVTSFALNYYLADGFGSSAPFKITNLVIHLLNTLLVFWLTALILMRVQAVLHINNKHAQHPRNAAYFVAACAALIWGIHPLQLTSVLYVVQRMTELATTFTLLGLICYLYGREQLLAGHKTKGIWFVVIGFVGFGGLGILSKENAALLPLFAVLFEFVLFHHKSPWDKWPTLSTLQKRVIWVLATLIVLAILLSAVMYALPRYDNREFTMFERLLTQSRVLFFYLSLLLVPDLGRLSHQHDDIVISSSLLSPWTTLPSVLGIIALTVAGFWLRKRNPMLSLGILWFFTGHLLESTIFPLEIAHEHRNYLPSFGFALGIASVLAHSTPAVLRHRGLPRRLIWAAFAVIAVAFAGTTYLRAEQWSNHNTFYRYEVAHHPNSARVQSGYSVLLEAQGQFQEAEVAIQRAAILAPHEAAHMVDLMLLDAKQKKLPDPKRHAEITHRLVNSKITATTIQTLSEVDACLQTWCSSLVPYMQQWIEAILKNPKAPDPGYFQYRLGRIKTLQHEYLEALNLFQKAHEADKQFLHPLFEQINIFLKLEQVHNAEFVLKKLKEANTQSRYPRDREIAEVEADINQMKGKDGQR